MKRQNWIFLIAIISIFSFVTGCVPIQQIEWKTSQDKIRISPDKSSLSISVLTATSNPTNQPQIDSHLSFAISPSGKRLDIEAQENEFAKKDAATHPTAWTLTDVYLINPANNQKLSWKNGDWKLDLFFKGSTPQPPIHSEFRLYTFWYCPLFTRPF